MTDAIAIITMGTSAVTIRRVLILCHDADDNELLRIEDGKLFLYKKLAYESKELQEIEDKIITSMEGSKNENR